MKRLINAGTLVDKLRTRKVMSGEKAVQDAYETAMWDALNEPEVTLNALRDEVYEDAVAHGLWEGCEKGDVTAYRAISLIKGEVDELETEALIALKFGTHCMCITDSAKERLEGLYFEAKRRYVEELADVIIMCMSVAGKLGIDIDAAVKRKMQINKTRPWKHGKE